MCRTLKLVPTDLKKWPCPPGYPLFSNLNMSWVDQVAVVEFRWREFIRLGQWKDKTDCRFRLVHCSFTPFTVSKQTSAATSRAEHRAANSVYSKTDVNGLIFAAALLGQVLGSRWVVIRRNGDERHFPRLCHLMLAVHYPLNGRVIWLSHSGLASQTWR